MIRRCPSIRQCTYASSLVPFRDKGKGRLGSPRFPKTTLGDVPFPVELRLPGVRVVSLAASMESVQVPFLCLTNTFISYCPDIPTGLAMRLVLTAVCMSGVGAFDDFYLMLKPLGVDNASQ